jgi:DNA-binding NtrC family response regulator
VLVVDDDAAIRLLCRVNLELEGYRVLEASSVEHAGEVLSDDTVDVVLLDIHVGSDDGFALVEKVRAAQPDASVALFTGSAHVEGDRRDAVEAVIPKPFSLEELSATVGRLAAA